MGSGLALIQGGTHEGGALFRTRYEHIHVRLFRAVPGPQQSVEAVPHTGLPEYVQVRDSKNKYVFIWGLISR